MNRTIPTVVAVMIGALSLSGCTTEVPGPVRTVYVSPESSESAYIPDAPTYDMDVPSSEVDDSAGNDWAGDAINDYARQQECRDLAYDLKNQSYDLKKMADDLAFDDSMAGLDGGSSFDKPNADTVRDLLARAYDLDQQATKVKLSC